MQFVACDSEIARSSHRLVGVILIVETLDSPNRGEALSEFLIFTVTIHLWIVFYFWKILRHIRLRKLLHLSKFGSFLILRHITLQKLLHLSKFGSVLQG